jgi:hypothetical protein
MTFAAFFIVFVGAAVMDGDEVLPGVYWVIIIRQDIRNPSKKIQPSQYASYHFSFA